MKGDAVKYTYHTSLKWTDEKKGFIQSLDKPNIIVACPPEFGGHSGIWSPEDLFLSSIEVCTMTTFLWLLNKEKISIKSYESKAIGIAELKDNVFRFHEISVKMKIGISCEKDKAVIDKIIKKIPQVCLVSKSIIPEVKLDPYIFIE